MISPDPMDDMDRKVYEDIQREGWSGIAVFPTKHDDPDTLPFNYTVGLVELDHPELLVVGMNLEQGHGILSSAVNLIKHDVTFTAGTYSYLVLQGLRVGFVRVLDPLSTEFMMSMAHRFYGEVHALQLVWPDRNDRFPWHSDYENEYLTKQPLTGPWTGAE